MMNLAWLGHLWTQRQAREQRAAWVAELNALYALDKHNANREAELERIIAEFDKASP